MLEIISRVYVIRFLMVAEAEAGGFVTKSIEELEAYE